MDFDQDLVHQLARETSIRTGVPTAVVRMIGGEYAAVREAHALNLRYLGLDIVIVYVDGKTRQAAPHPSALRQRS